MKKLVISVIIVVVLLMSLVSCSKSYNFSDGSVSDFKFYGTDGIDYDYWDAENSAPTYGGASSSKPAADINEADGNDLDSRKIIKNADISFQTKEFDKFIDSLNDAINSVGGFIQNSEIYEGGISTARYSRSASVSVRVPANRYNEFINTVGNLGAVTRSNEYQDDVTFKYIDTESRIKALETEYDALMELLAKAESIDYIIILRERISEIQYELESYKAQIRKYDDLISYCTVNIDVEEVRVETVSGDKLSFGERISNGLSESFRDIGVDLENFAVWFVTSLPYIIIWAVVIAVIVIVCVTSSKRAKKKRIAKMQAYNNMRNNSDSEIK